MSSNNELDIRRQIILDHYENPLNKIENKDKLNTQYKSANNNSPSCIDNLTAYVAMKNKKINDIKFLGLGCAIATSSTDIMSQLLKNKTKPQALKIINNYLNMIDGNKFDDKSLGELFVFQNVNKQLNRIKCAKVGINAIKMALEQYE
jgi:nitrogen fixation NifU-like protein